MYDNSLQFTLMASYGLPSINFDSLHSLFSIWFQDHSCMLPILINSDVLLDANSRLIDVVWLCNQKIQGSCKANSRVTRKPVMHKWIGTLAQLLQNLSRPSAAVNHQSITDSPTSWKKKFCFTKKQAEEEVLEQEGT